MRGKGPLALTFLLLACIVMGNGCASSSPDDLDTLLSELEARYPSEDNGVESAVPPPTIPQPEEVRGESDLPDIPVAGLPPLGTRGGTRSVRAEGWAVAEADVQASADMYGTDLTIQPECIVQVSVEEDPRLNGSYPVNKIGAIELGYIGPIILYNRTEGEAAKKIAEVLRDRHFKKATVKVKILRASYDKVQVSGAVMRPGLIQIGAGDSISLNDALLRAGGIRPSARGAKVKIVRDGLKSALALAMDGDQYPLLTEGGDPNVPDVFLDNNDVAYVFSGHEVTPVEIGEKEILVLGEVKRQGVFAFKPTEPCTMMHLYFKMGGFPPYADQRKVRVLRRDQEGSERELTVNVKEILKEGDPAEDFPLKNGDRVIVPSRTIRLF